MTDPPEADELTLRPPPATEAATTPEDAVFTRQGGAWSETSRLSETTFRMRLGGLFDTTWMTALCNTLAGHRVSIDHAHARLGHDGSWIAELHVIALPGAPDPRMLPLLEFTKLSESGPTNPLELDAVHVIESHSYGGALVLTVEAADSLGLLGALLAVVGRASLVPVEMHIETRTGRIYDSLWLGATGGGKPSDDARSALEQLLAECVRAGQP